MDQNFLFYFYKNWYPIILRVSDKEIAFRFSKFKMADKMANGFRIEYADKNFKNLHEIRFEGFLSR